MLLKMSTITPMNWNPTPRRRSDFDVTSECGRYRVKRERNHAGFYRYAVHKGGVRQIGCLTFEAAKTHAEDDARRERTEDARWELLNSFGGGSFHDGVLRDLIARP
jgi:hypothetical protein